MAFPQERLAEWNTWVKRRAIERKLEQEEDAKATRNAEEEDAQAARNAEEEDATHVCARARSNE